MASLLVPEEEAQRKKEARSQQMALSADLARRLQEAEERETLARAFKEITQGQKNSAVADAETANTAIDILTKGLEPSDAQGKAKPVGQ
jgi:predicted phage gp36 major capsid-like protein